MLKKKLNCQRGFTLIEMVIVIVVIGILMTLAFQGIAGVQQSARDTRRLADLRRVETQLELFFNRCGHYPITGSSATSCGTPPSTGSTIEWDPLLITALDLVVSADDVPKDPLPHLEYHYWFGPHGLNYVIGADMERRGVNTGETFPPNSLTCAGTGDAVLYCIQS